MINIKRCIVLGVFFLWVWFSWYRYTGHLKGVSKHKRSIVNIKIFKTKLKPLESDGLYKKEPLHEIDSLALTKAPIKLNSSEELIIPLKNKAIYRDTSALLNSKIAHLAEQLKRNGKAISIIGYTSGNEDVNLGRTRAWVIKKEFLSHGVNSTQLQTSNQIIDTSTHQANSEFSQHSKVVIKF